MTKIEALREFIGRSSYEIIENPFTKTDSSLLSSIGDQRFYAYLKMIEDATDGSIDSVMGIEDILSHAIDIEEKSKRQLLQILKNEKAKTLYHMMGRVESDEDNMEVVSMDGFVFSARENGWVFE